jgi:hypothetical protein
MNSREVMSAKCGAFKPLNFRLLSSYLSCFLMFLLVLGFYCVAGH